MKSDLKDKAILLRKQGFTYSEILRQIPVAKSTISLWLRSVGLSKDQEQRITEKKLLAGKRGVEKWRQQRIEKTMSILEKARSEINIIKFDKEKLWIMGTMLYWAEGAKEKISSISQGIVFSNSDKYMIKLFIKWLRICLEIPDNKIKFQIYIHENYKNEIFRVKNYWSMVTGFPEAKFDKIYFKKHNPATIRENKGNNYFGLLRICVKESSNLNRKITGWIEGICIQCGVV